MVVRPATGLLTVCSRSMIVAHRPPDVADLVVRWSVRS
jgi:hypothetical protein